MHHRCLFFSPFDLTVKKKVRYNFRGTIHNQQKHPRRQLEPLQQQCSSICRNVNQSQLLTSSNRTELPPVLILPVQEGRGPWGLFVAS